MPQNNFERITRFDKKALDAVFAAESKSAILKNGSKFIDLNYSEAGYVKLFDLKVDRLGNYVRAGHDGGGDSYSQYNGTDSRVGYPIGSASGGFTLYPLRYERGKQIPIDRMDNEETANLIMANTETQFFRTAVVPEVDTVTFSTIASHCKESLGNLVNETIGDNEILGKFDESFRQMQELGVPETDQVIFVNPTVYKQLKQTNEITRFLTQPDLKGVKREVEGYSGREIVVVPSDRFYTGVELYPSNGYGPKTTSHIINYMVVSKAAVIPIVKLEQTRILSGNNVSNFDGYLMNIHLYHDILVPKNKVIGSVVSVSTTLATTVANTLKVDIDYVDGTSFLFNNYFTIPAGINGKIVHSDTALVNGTAYASAEEIVTGEKFTAISPVTEYFAVLDRSTNTAIAVSGAVTMPTA